MALKRNWFRPRDQGSGARTAEEEYSIQDLIVLERYEEAEARLQARLKQDPRDLHARQKLAEVYVALRQVGKAVEEYLTVAEATARDGFYDRGIALLSKATRLLPGDPTLRQRLERFRQAKSMDHSRTLAVEGLRQSKVVRGLEAATASVEIQRRWHCLVGTALVQRLDGEQLKRLFSAVRVLTLKAGEALAERGGDRAVLYLLVDGEMEAFLAASGTTLRTFSPGAIVGEGALLEHQPWPADYRASKDSVILALDRQGLELSLVGNPDPRSFLDLLREQHLDREVAAAVERLGIT